jgi:hypothetical protein
VAGECVSSSCYQLLLAHPGLADGDYTIDPDGPGPLPPMTASCDMTTDGGGWTLVLQYLHAGGTNPDVLARPDSLPLLGSDVLGGDESGSAHWGHAVPSLVAALQPTEVRFLGKTSAHARVVHFKTVRRTALDYLTTGAGSFSGIQADFVPLSGHTAHLPGAANAFFADSGPQALTTHPFYGTGLYHWNINPPAPYSGRWEVDDWLRTDTVPANGYSASTMHRVWIREGPTCVDGAQNAAEIGVDCGGGTCPGCLPGVSCTKEADCVPGAICAPGTGGSTCSCQWEVCGTGALALCTETATDFWNCGACGHACVLSQACVGSKCVDLPAPDFLHRIDFVPSCSTVENLALFDITNWNSFPVLVSYQSGETFSGDLLLEPNIDYQVMIYMQSLISFSYQRYIFRTVATNDILCHAPQSPGSSLRLLQVCSTATESVFDLVNNWPAPVTATVQVAEVTLTLTTPGSSSLRFLAPRNDAALYYEGAPVVFSVPSLVPCPTP